MDFKPVVTISWELLFQIINTVILFLVLKKLLFKPVLNIIEKRENMIQDDLATGAKAKNEGIALKKEYEEKAKLQIEQAKREEEALRQRSLAELEDRLQSAMDDLEKKSQIQHDAWVDALFSHIVGEEAERGDGGC